MTFVSRPVPPEPRRVHPQATPEYWEGLARSERAFAREDRGRRMASVESIQLHEQSAKEYDARAAEIRATLATKHYREIHEDETYCGRVGTQWTTTADPRDVTCADCRKAIDDAEVASREGR